MNTYRAKPEVLHGAIKKTESGLPLNKEEKQALLSVVYLAEDIIYPSRSTTRQYAVDKNSLKNADKKTEGAWIKVLGKRIKEFEDRYSPEEYNPLGDANLTALDQQIIVRLSNKEILQDILEDIFPATEYKSSFDLFYAQTRISLGDILRNKFSGVI